MKRGVNLFLALALGATGYLTVSAGFGAYRLYQEHQAMLAWIVQVQQNSLPAKQAQQPGEPQAPGKDAKKGQPAE